MNLKERYKKTISQKLQKDLKCQNVMTIPKIEKVVLNMWIGTYIRSWNKDFSSLKNHLTLIAWQAPIVKKSRKAISNFKLRAWMPVWMMVTLRWDRMYDFLNKLTNIVLPRVRDFRWVNKKSFDRDWNYNFWIKEHSIFLEVPHDDVIAQHWIQITVKTNTTNVEESRALLKEIWFPFSK